MPGKGFAESSKSIDIKVLPNGSEIAVEPQDNWAFGDNLEFQVAVTTLGSTDAQATGSVGVSVNDTTATTHVLKSDGTTSVLLPGLDIGTHNVTVSYPGTDEITGSSISFPLSIAPAATSSFFTVSPSPVTWEKSSR